MRATASQVVDTRFSLIRTFDVVVPQDNDHATHLERFKAAHEGEFCYYSRLLTDANFAKTPAFTPGRRFLVKAFRIGQRVVSDDCLAQLKRVKATLVGAQGIALAYEQKISEFPKNRWSISFDEKDNLPLVGDVHCVPLMHRRRDGGVEFCICEFERVWNDYYILLAFCDPE